MDNPHNTKSLIEKLSFYTEVASIFSILVVLYILFNGDYFINPLWSVNWALLLLSLLLLCCGHVFDALATMKTISIVKKGLNFRTIIYVFGITIFTKYIPGKVWPIMGRSVLLAKLCEIDFLKTQQPLWILQFIQLWLGLTIGIIGLFLIGNFPILRIAIIFWVLLLIILLLLVSTSEIYGIFNKESMKSPNPFGMKNCLKLIPYVLLTWILFTGFFYFLVASISESFPSFHVLFFLPLAITAGVISIITPGGIGVREGILYLLLTDYGMSSALSLSVAALSRLLWILSESFIFALAIFVRTKLD